MVKWFLILALAAWAEVGGGQAPTPEVPQLPLSPKDLLPAGPVRSADRSIAVWSSVAMENDRAPVLLFVDRAREEFLRAMRLRAAPQGLLLDIVLGNQRDGDTRVLTGRMRFPNGEVRERIELPDPKAADLESLRRSVWEALYRSWLVSTGGGGEAILEYLPAWLMAGVVRRMDTETWVTDFDRVLMLWSRARLPMAADLLAAENPAAASEPALGAMLADYLMNRKVGGGPGRGERPANPNGIGGSVLDALIQDAAKGGEWSVGRVTRLVTGGEDAVALDEDLDLWFSAMGRKVIVPGLTTEGTMRRFCLNLLIYPSDYGNFFDQRNPWITFQELAVSTDPVMRRAAAAQIQRVQIAAVGRDGTFRAMTEAYAQFLKAVAAGKKPGEIALLLMKADAQRKDLEEALKGGRMVMD